MDQKTRNPAPAPAAGRGNAPPPPPGTGAEANANADVPPGFGPGQQVLPKLLTFVLDGTTPMPTPMPAEAPR